jgi:hypothetical protein
VSPLPPPGTPAAPPPVASPQRPAGSGLEFRFALLYGALATILVASIVGVVLIARESGPPTQPAWSSWRPAAGSSSAMTSEIATHVSNQYKLNKAGAPLVAIVPSAPEGTSGTTVTPVSTIGFLTSATATSCCARVVSTTDNLQVQLCGLGARCAITRGVPTADRGRLVRREALELALYTFKYVGGVDNVVAILPPGRTQETSTLSKKLPTSDSASSKPVDIAVLFVKPELQPLLSRPLSSWLPGEFPPTVAQMAKAPEAGLVDQLTAHGLFSEQLQQAQDGSNLIVLDPLPPQ